jgi:hypothetical protein
MRKRVLKQNRKPRRFLPNTGTEDEEAAFDIPELEDWMTGGGGK